MRVVGQQRVELVRDLRRHELARLEAERGEPRDPRGGARDRGELVEQKTTVTKTVTRRCSKGGNP